MSAFVHDYARPIARGLIMGATVAVGLGMVGLI